MPARLSDRWTPEEIAEMRRRHVAGESLASIGAAFGISRQRVHYLLVNTRYLSKQKSIAHWTPAILNDMRQRVVKGESLPSIGAFYGISGYRVRFLIGSIRPLIRQKYACLRAEANEQFLRQLAQSPTDFSPLKASNSKHRKAK